MSTSLAALLLSLLLLPITALPAAPTATTPASSSQEDGSPLSYLRGWLATHGARTASVHFDLRQPSPFSSSPAGFTIVASRPIAAGEEVLFVPRRAIHHGDVEQHSGRIGRRQLAMLLRARALTLDQVRSDLSHDILLWQDIVGSLSPEERVESGGVGEVPGREDGASNGGHASSERGSHKRVSALSLAPWLRTYRYAAVARRLWGEADLEWIRGEPWAEVVYLNLWSQRQTIDWFCEQVMPHLRHEYPDQFTPPPPPRPPPPPPPRPPRPPAASAAPVPGSTSSTSSQDAIGFTCATFEWVYSLSRARRLSIGMVAVHDMMDHAVASTANVVHQVTRAGDYRGVASAHIRAGETLRSTYVKGWSNHRSLMYFDFVLPRGIDPGRTSVPLRFVHLARAAAAAPPLPPLPATASSRGRCGSGNKHAGRPVLLISNKALQQLIAIAEEMQPVEMLVFNTTTTTATTTTTTTTAASATASIVDGLISDTVRLALGILTAADPVAALNEAIQGGYWASAVAGTLPLLDDPLDDSDEPDKVAGGGTTDEDAPTLHSRTSSRPPTFFARFPASARTGERPCCCRGPRVRNGTHPRGSYETGRTRHPIFRPIVRTGCNEWPKIRWTCCKESSIRCLLKSVTWGRLTSVKETNDHTR